MDILPACMPLQTDNFEDMNCYFTGWGLTYSSELIKLVFLCKLVFKLIKSEDGQSHETLREIQLQTLNRTECDKYSRPESEQKYCSGQLNVNQDTCQVHLTLSFAFNLNTIKYN